MLTMTQQVRAEVAPQQLAQRSKLLVHQPDLGLHNGLDGTQLVTHAFAQRLAKRLQLARGELVHLPVLGLRPPPDSGD